MMNSASTLAKHGRETRRRVPNVSVTTLCRPEEGCRDVAAIIKLLGTRFLFCVNQDVYVFAYIK